MDFVTGVNRLLRIEHVITGQDDDITTFADTQHAADISLAQIAIQDEIAELISERLIPYEHATNSITLVAGTRTYALQTNFTRFYGLASFYDAAQNYRIYEYAGGESKLMHYDYQYKTTSGTPVWWYWSDTTVKQIALYQLPDSAWDGHTLAYDYEASVMVSDEADTLPFQNNEEAFSFIACAARRFNYMRNKKELGIIGQDATYGNAKSRLYALIRPTNAPGYYGNGY